MPPYYNQTASSYPDPHSIQAPTWKNAQKRQQIALIGVVLLVLLGSLLAGISIHQNQISQTSATTQTGTQHQQTMKNTTATAMAQATTSIQAFPTYLPGQGTLALNDPLLKQHWYERELKSWGGSCHLMNDGLHARQIQSDPVQAGQQHSGRAITCPAKATFKNFAFAVDMTIQQGDCGGIVFRDDTTTGKQYYFRICEDRRQTDTDSLPIHKKAIVNDMFIANEVVWRMDAD